jgi:hypothetical protein
MRGLKTDLLPEPEKLQKMAVGNLSSDKKDGKPNTIFKPLWNESKLAIKQSVRFKDFDNFRRHLEENLPQNSDYTRKRFTRTIIKRFFPERSLETIQGLVWKYYKNDEYLQEVMRYQFLESEPIVADFVITNVLPLPVGSLLDANSLRDFTIAKYGRHITDTATSITSAVRDLGFVYRSNRRSIVRQIEAPKTSLLILTHFLFAETPRTVSLKEIINHNYWRFLGINMKVTVRQIFTEAAERGIISKYTVLDELEQLTTRYTLKQFLEERLKL